MSIQINMKFKSKYKLSQIIKINIFTETIIQEYEKVNAELIKNKIENILHYSILIPKKKIATSNVTLWIFSIISKVYKQKKIFISLLNKIRKYLIKVFSRPINLLNFKIEDIILYEYN